MKAIEAIEGLYVHHDAHVIAPMRVVATYRGADRYGRWSDRPRIRVALPGRQDRTLDYWPQQLVAYDDQERAAKLYAKNEQRRKELGANLPPTSGPLCQYFGDIDAEDNPWPDCCQHYAQTSIGPIAHPEIGTIIINVCRGCARVIRQRQGLEIAADAAWPGLW